MFSVVEKQRCKLRVETWDKWQLEKWSENFDTGNDVIVLGNFQHEKAATSLKMASARVAKISNLCRDTVLAIVMHRIFSASVVLNLCMAYPPLDCGSFRTAIVIAGLVALSRESNIGR